MFTSTIIPTIGRESLIRTVESVLAQEFNQDEFEVIVVNDTGEALPYTSWQDSRRVTVMNTNRRERCFARNSGASIAKGQYLHFLDDDDWLLPNALKAWWLQTDNINESVAWIYGNSQFIHANSQRTGKYSARHTGNCFNHVTSGSWIPLGASLIKASAFFEVGGFDPSYRVAQDKNICRLIALNWHFAHTTSEVVCFLRNRNSSSTPYELASYNETRSRNAVLSASGSFARMRSSVTDAYWAGKLTRAYLTCAWWNIKTGRPGQALWKGIQAVCGFIVTSKHIASRKYWMALTHPHVIEDIY